MEQLEWMQSTFGIGCNLQKVASAISEADEFVTVDDETGETIEEVAQ